MTPGGKLVNQDLLPSAERQCTPAAGISKGLDTEIPTEADTFLGSMSYFIRHYLIKLYN